MNYISQVQERGNVFFPKWKAEKHYMIPFNPRASLPHGLHHWQRTVDYMLTGYTADKAYLMIDQGIVRKGRTHRRPGLHIEGYWCEGLAAHGGGHGGWPPSHTPYRRHRGSHMGGDWSKSNFSKPELTLLASDVVGCRAFEGEYSGEILEGGDCSKIPTEGMKEIIMQPNKVYAGNVSMLHESIPSDYTALRTVVRITLPGITIQ